MGVVESLHQVVFHWIIDDLYRRFSAKVAVSNGSKSFDCMSEFWPLGIEIGGTKLQLGIGHGQGKLRALDRLRVDPSRGANGVFEQIEDAVPRLLANAKLDRKQIQAAGIGFGGPVDVQTGRIQKSFQIFGWDDYPLADWIGERLDIPRVVVENDADTAGLAEARFGAGVGHSPLLYITVGSGIGGATHRRSANLSRVGPRRDGTWSPVGTGNDPLRSPAARGSNKWPPAGLSLRPLVSSLKGNCAMERASGSSFPWLRVALTISRRL